MAKSIHKVRLAWTLQNLRAPDVSADSQPSGTSLLWDPRCLAEIPRRKLPHDYGCRNYALDAGSAVEDSWKLSDFDDGVYRLRVYGPNGYFWEFAGSAEDPTVQAQLAPASRGTESADVELLLTASSATDGLAISVCDNAYGNADQSLRLASGGRTSVRVSTFRSHRWYDLSLRVSGSARFERQFAGRIETGAWGFSDPSIGIST